MKQPETAEAGRLPAKAQGMTLMKQPEAAKAGSAVSTIETPPPAAYSQPRKTDRRDPKPARVFVPAVIKPVFISGMRGALKRAPLPRDADWLPRDVE
jgi:hypothetical protein